MTGIRWSREIIPQKSRGAIWIMVGRPRKIGKRERNGRIARTYENPRAQIAAQPHRLAVAPQYREWPEAESEFGRMMLRGVITPAQFEAGSRYAQLAASYRAVWDMPPLTPRAVDLTHHGVAVSQGMASEQARAIKRRYDEAFEACAEAGNRAQRAVKDHAVFDRKVSDFGALEYLRRGLDKLIHHFGIDERLQIRLSVRNAR